MKKVIITIMLAAGMAISCCAQDEKHIQAERIDSLEAEIIELKTDLIELSELQLQLCKALEYKLLGVVYAGFDAVYFYDWSQLRQVLDMIREDTETLKEEEEEKL